MDAQYIRDCTWQIKNEALKKILGEFGIENIPDTMEGIEDVIREKAHLDIVLNYITEDERMLAVDILDNETYPDEDTERFYKAAAPYSTGGLSFDVGLVSESYRVSFVDGEVVYTSLELTETIYVVFNKEEKFIGTVPESSKSKYEKEGYIVRSVFETLLDDISLHQLNMCDTI